MFCSLLRFHFFTQLGDFPLDRNAALVSVGGESSVSSSVPFSFAELSAHILPASFGKKNRDAENRLQQKGGRF